MSDMDRVEALTRSVDALSETVEDLVAQVKVDRKARAEEKKSYDRAARNSIVKVRLLAALTALCIVLVVAVSVGFFRINTIATCQSRVSTEFRDGTAAKSEAADEADDARIAGLDEFELFLHGVQDRDMPQVVRDEAYRRQYESIARQRATAVNQKQVRAENQVPTDAAC